MDYMSYYCSPIGGIFLSADDVGLTGLWFEKQKSFQPLDTVGESQTIADTKWWLDLYFSGREPEFEPPLQFTGTAFQMEVWEILRIIPYGRTMTYGEIAKQIADRRGLSRMSPQAVGGAVGRNKIGIIIPCHRVIGADGSLTGYAGGLDKKEKLLRMEMTGYGRPGKP